MIEVFIIDIKQRDQAGEILTKINQAFPGLSVNVDLYGFEQAFPCGHSIMRVEGSDFVPENICKALASAGFRCEILQDKICN